MTAKYIIKEVFQITGRGIVLAGHMEEGTVLTGDFIEFTALRRKRKRQITGVNYIRKPNEKDKVGLLIKCADDKEIDDLRTWKPNDSVGVISKE